MKFYYLATYWPGRMEADTYYYDATDENLVDAEQCPGCGKYISSLRQLPPYSVKIRYLGKIVGDIAFGPGYDILVSERLKTLFGEERMTGLKGFHPVTIVGVEGRTRRTRPPDPPAYYRVSVVRGQGIIDQEASGFEWEEPPTCDVCRRGEDLQRWKRIIIDPSTWSGEDVFYARGLASSVFCTARFKQFCETHQITNAILIPAEEYARDYYPQH
jgi:hypothetical protein